MNLLVASALGILAGCGVWLLLRARTFDLVLGLTLLCYAVNLFIFSMGRLGSARRRSSIRRCRRRCSTTRTRCRRRWC